MKVKEICLCLFAVSDALLGFLIRMAKPSRVGTMYTYTWLLLLSLVLSLCQMDAMKPEVKEGTWKGKNRTCIPLANRVSRTHTHILDIHCDAHIKSKNMLVWLALTSRVIAAKIRI